MLGHLLCGNNCYFNILFIWISGSNYYWSTLAHLFACYTSSHSQITRSGDQARMYVYWYVAIFSIPYVQSSQCKNIDMWELCFCVLHICCLYIFIPTFAGHYPARAMPSAGVFPWFKSILCDVQNPCFTVPVASETPGQINARLSNSSLRLMTCKVDLLSCYKNAMCFPCKSM